MNQRMLTGAFALLTWTVTVTAQAQTAQMPRPSETNPRVTVQGCLERSPGAGAVKAGTTGAAGSGGSFLLTSIATPAANRGAAAPAADQPPGPGAIGGGSITDLQTTYRLDADAGTLTPHVGHRVQVIGVVDTRTIATSGQINAGAPMPAVAMNAPTLKVQEVKMIASSCMGS